MLVEHTFITTLEDEDAVAMSCDMLNRMGYYLERRDSGSVVGSKGNSKAAKAKRFDELPQQVSLQCDRGRVNIAASITPRRKPESLHTDLALATVRTFEQLLAKLAPAGDALTEWTSVHHRIEERANRDARRRTIGLGIAISTVVVVIGLIVVLAANT